MISKGDLMAHQESASSIWRVGLPWVGTFVALSLQWQCIKEFNVLGDRDRTGNTFLNGLTRGSAQSWWGTHVINKEEDPSGFSPHT